jgi:hypothetical protein
VKPFLNNGEIGKLESNNYLINHNAMKYFSLFLIVFLKIQTIFSQDTLTSEGFFQMELPQNFDKNKIEFPTKTDYERRTRTLSINDKDATLIRGHEFNRDEPTSLSQDKDETKHVDDHIKVPDEVKSSIYQASLDPMNKISSTIDVLGREQVFIDSNSSSPS